METILLVFFVAIAVVLVWMVVCAGIGVLWALVENSVGAGIIGGFILWAISCLFFDYAWTDLTVAWWGVIAGAIIGLYLTYQEVNSDEKVSKSCLVRGSFLVFTG